MRKFHLLTLKSERVVFVLVSFKMREKAMPEAVFKFDTSEEQEAFAKLLSFLTRRQRWDDLERYPIGNVCHICGNKIAVKSGVVPFDDFFEDKKIDGYTFWSCCLSCHNRGWILPCSVSFRGGMRYWRISPEDKIEEHIITDIKIFNFPSIVLINADTVSITV
jgi:hypothetical protein